MRGHWFLLVFGVFWTALIGVADFAVGYGFVSNLRAQSFATTTGTITHSEVTKERGKRGRTNYGVDIRYSYSIDGRRLEGDTYHYSSGSSSDREWAEATVRTHPVGAPVTVYYDEGDPSASVLTRGIDGGDLFLLQFLAPFNVVMLGLLRFGGAPVWHWWNGTPQQPIRPFHQGNTVRVRMAQLAPVENGFIGGGAAAFLLGFVCLFTYGFHPPMALALLLWALVIGAGVATALWDRRKQLAGDYDLVVGDRNVEVPAEFGGTRQTIARSAISGVAIEATERRVKGGKNTLHLVTLQRRDGPPAVIAEWYDAESAAALAAWLREKIGVR